MAMTRLVGEGRDQVDLLLGEGLDLSLQTANTPTESPSRSIGTPRIVR